MKRLFIFSLLLFPAVVYAKNKISMVTYFPVPYVAYSRVNVNQQMDIGLTSACDMKLGCSETSATLNAARVNLNGGKLNLDGGRGIRGNTLSLGSSNGEGRISFRNVRIQTGTMESVNAEDMNVSALKLFGKEFPSCKDKDSSGQMQWASLKLKGASSNELYLMCGTLADSSEAEPPSSAKVCSLPSPQLISQTYKSLIWDGVMTGDFWIEVEAAELSKWALGPGDCSSGSFDKISYSGSASCDGAAAGTTGDITTFEELNCENENLIRHEETLTCNQCIKKGGYQFVIQLHCEYAPAGTEWECPADKQCGTLPGSCL
ncbi:MAG: hypothetical protein Q4P84_08845 [Elusimicrobiales bacterium]|nr:hypothetical protein [Elusimicrobiales bacterium]